MKSDHQQFVEQFMRLARQDVPAAPCELDEPTRILRAKLILEEALETIRDGLGVTVFCAGTAVRESYCEYRTAGDFDLVATVDGCCDLRVVTTGTLSACGVPDLPVQMATDLNNLEKFGPGHSWRIDGKLLKPPGHKPPNLAGILNSLRLGT